MAYGVEVARKRNEVETAMKVLADLRRQPGREHDFACALKSRRRAKLEAQVRQNFIAVSTSLRFERPRRHTP